MGDEGFNLNLIQLQGLVGGYLAGTVLGFNLNLIQLQGGRQMGRRTYATCFNLNLIQLQDTLPAGLTGS